MLTPQQFFNNHNGRAYDVDNAYGPQCVDAFKLFTLEQFGISNYTCTNGWASGLWIYRKEKPYYQHFIEVSVNDLQDGDWVIWDNGSKDCPDSHIAMYYNNKFFSQRQNGSVAFSLADLSKDGILGVLRPKIYQSNKTKYINIPEWIEERNVYRCDNKTQFATIKPKKFGGLTYAIYNMVDNGYYAEIETLNFGRCLVRVTQSTPITDSPMYSHGNY